jgi:hypothetical protein
LGRLAVSRGDPTDIPARIDPVLRELRRDPRDYHNGYRNRRSRYRRHAAEALRRAKGLLARLRAA